MTQQLAKKIRVYELARELGLTNKEALDLCQVLGIGVKSHSSSIEDAQADRARRRADADGLRRDVSPAEPESAAPVGRRAGARLGPTGRFGSESPGASGRGSGAPVTSTRPSTPVPGNEIEPPSTIVDPEPAPAIAHTGRGSIPTVASTGTGADETTGEQTVTSAPASPISSGSQTVAEPTTPGRPSDPRLVTSDPAVLSEGPSTGGLPAGPTTTFEAAPNAGPASTERSAVVASPSKTMPGLPTTPSPAT
ncbi:MAG: hypothetical protein DLM54_07640, partial [Acidimicrobiales bacterium]